MTELLLEIYGEEIPPSFQYEGKEKLKKHLLLLNEKNYLQRNKFICDG